MTSKRHTKSDKTKVFGPGYRVYFDKDGDKLVILQGGSRKQPQQQAIEAAQERWTDYWRRKASQRRQMGGRRQWH